MDTFSDYLMILVYSTEQNWTDPALVITNVRFLSVERLTQSSELFNNNLQITSVRCHGTLRGVVDVSSSKIVGWWSLCSLFA